MSASGKSVRQAKFALCPAAHNTTCEIGSLPAFQAVEILVTDHIEKVALPGNQVTLTVSVQGSSDDSSPRTLSPAEATITTVVGQGTASPAPISTDTAFPPPPSVPGLPGTTVTPGSITSLFPVVTPGPTPSSTTSRATAKHKVTRFTSTASSLPIDPRLIGGQVAGLAVLTAAITMVVARLSLRTPQPAGQPLPSPAPSAPGTDGAGQALAEAEGQSEAGAGDSKDA
ncbi:MAG TPA: hypothetical protein VFQ44_10250 [Streptosporangiaceae bacterium]|nr:hypothetical protein [Streptosporangiaceae bacterium]